MDVQWTKEYDGGHMPEFKTLQRTSEVNALSEALQVACGKFGVHIEVVGVEYAPRVGLFHCIARNIDDIGKVMNLTASIEYALGKNPITINTSTTKESTFDVVVQFDGVPLFPGWTDAASQSESALSVPLGVAASGNDVEFDLEIARHILIAGQTGTGKSTVMHSIICSLMCKHTPETLKFALMDPKLVELTLYAGSPSLYAPVVTSSEDAADVFMQLKQEMDRRLKVGAQTVQSLPTLVVIVDEFSDFMCSEYAASIESDVLALAAEGHLVGIHLILSTSRPSTNIFTDKIRNAFPSRIVGKLGSVSDSTTMLNQSGAERLLGLGDMLLRTPEQNELIRFLALQINEGDIRDVLSQMHIQS